MAYFVTGATGFIGRFLVGNLLERGEPDLRAGAQGLAEEARRAARALGRGPTSRSSASSATSRSRSSASPTPTCASSRARSRTSSTSPRSTTSRRPPRTQQAANVEGTRHAVEFAERDQRRLLPPRELDRRGGTVRRRVPRGHVRGGRGARPSVLPHQARLRRRGAQRMQAAVPHLPARASWSATRRPARSTRSTGRTTSSS